MQVILADFANVGRWGTMTHGNDYIWQSLQWLHLAIHQAMTIFGNPAGNDYIWQCTKYYLAMHRSKSHFSADSPECRQVQNDNRLLSQTPQSTTLDHAVHLSFRLKMNWWKSINARVTEWKLISACNWASPSCHWLMNIWPKQQGLFSLSVLKYGWEIFHAGINMTGDSLFRIWKRRQMDKCCFQGKSTM